MTVDTELQALYQQHNMLTSTLVLAFAQAHPTSELFKQFNWNGAAAHAQRLAKASRLIASITTLYNATVRLQEYPSVGGGEHVDRARVKGDPNYRRHMIRSRLRAIRAAALGLSDIQTRGVPTFCKSVLAMVDALAITCGINM